MSAMSELDSIVEDVKIFDTFQAAQLTVGELLEVLLVRIMQTNGLAFADKSLVKAVRDVLEVRL